MSCTPLISRGFLDSYCSACGIKLLGQNVNDQIIILHKVRSVIGLIIDIWFILELMVITTQSMCIIELKVSLATTVRNGTIQEQMTSKCSAHYLNISFRKSNKSNNIIPIRQQQINTKNYLIIKQ